MLKCEPIREMMSLYIDNELNDIELVSFNKHIESCAECREELQLLQSVVESCHSFEELEVPENFQHELHEKLVQAQHDRTPVKPPWYLNWRIYSGIAAGILLVFVLKSQAFDTISNSMQKTEKAYVSDAQLEYSTSMAGEAAEEEMPEMGNGEKTVLADMPVENKEKMDTQSSKMESQSMAMIVPEKKSSVLMERSEQERTVKEETQQLERIQELPPQEQPTQKQLPMAAAIPSTAADAPDSGSGLQDGSSSISKTAKKETVCRGIYRDKKPLMVYYAVINTSQQDAEAIWKELQTKLNDFDGYFELRFKNEKPIVYIAKDKYSELISSVRAAGLEFTTDHNEADETSRYHNLLSQCDNVQKQIAELQQKLNTTSNQEEMEKINNELSVLIQEQERLNQEIAEMDRSIGKYIIEIHIVQ
ncbi:zf-HC2 domain-containing protein [Petroclostridium sp. X23]|uniref:anti-sigma factor family protein n=1 Tax=Petroclostridium sp. X23 TaxID=3045146 RepID=UPI0024AE43DB|nr:zf-HC2 domain-containing protein [Petroclostridium sp. X23]WHH59937.1 zf-HC2 domain-containing protein [Petroclostridium sp. X23]